VLRLWRGGSSDTSSTSADDNRDKHFHGVDPIGVEHHIEDELYRNERYDRFHVYGVEHDVDQFYRNDKYHEVYFDGVEHPVADQQYENEQYYGVHPDKHRVPNKHYDHEPYHRVEHYLTDELDRNEHYDGFHVEHDVDQFYRNGKCHEVYFYGVEHPAANQHCDNEQHHQVYDFAIQ